MTIGINMPSGYNGSIEMTIKEWWKIDKRSGYESRKQYNKISDYDMKSKFD
jgi:hypothetical protein